MTGAARDVASLTLPTDTSIVVRRAFGAPAHRVFRACTEPDLVRRWWSGGAGDVRVADVDLRVGGRWRFVIVGDGYTVGFHGVYLEIVPGARIACTEVYEGAPSAEATLCTYTFADVDGRCTLTLRTDLPAREDRDALLDSGMEEGLRASWDLLERVASSVR